MRYLYALLIATTFLTGCGIHNPFTPFTFRAWTEKRLAETTSFPSLLTRKVVLGHGISHTFTLQLYAPDTAWIDCGDGLILKLKDPCYTHDWATLSLADTNGDGVDDLVFTALAKDTPVPLKAIFLYQAGKWERYLLPLGF